MTKIIFFLNKIQFFLFVYNFIFCFSKTINLREMQIKSYVKCNLQIFVTHHIKCYFTLLVIFVTFVLLLYVIFISHPFCNLYICTFNKLPINIFALHSHSLISLYIYIYILFKEEEEDIGPQMNFCIQSPGTPGCASWRFQ